MIDPKLGGPDYASEVRFGVVMYGGVSLAIYINGVANEMYEMACSTPRPGGACEPASVSNQPMTSREVYRRLSWLVGNPALCKSYASAIEAEKKRVREHGSGAKLYLATPRIQKSSEAGFFKLIERAEPDGVLIRNLGAISYFRDAGIPMTGDFSLNVSNPLTADFLKQTGLERLTISYDLNIEQVLDLLASASPEWPSHTS